MDNQRKQERKSLARFTPAYSLNPKTLLGYLEDLTITGAKIIGDKAVETNRQIKLLIEIPSAIPSATVPRLILPARVAWCKAEDKPNYYDIGLEFSDLQLEEIHTIEAILRRYEFRRDVPTSRVD